MTKVAQNIILSIFCQKKSFNSHSLCNPNDPLFIILKDPVYRMSLAESGSQMSLEAELASLFITIKIIINLVYSITLIIKDIFENLVH